MNWDENNSWKKRFPLPPSLVSSTLSLGSTVAAKLRLGQDACPFQRILDDHNIFIMPHPCVTKKWTSEYLTSYFTTGLMVINLSGASYDECQLLPPDVVVLYGTVPYGFPCISIEQVAEFCIAAKKWLSADTSNAVAVHGSNTYNAPAMFLSIFMVWMSLCMSVSEALQYLYEAIDRIFIDDDSSNVIFPALTKSTSEPFNLFPSEKRQIRWALAVMRGKSEVAPRPLLLTRVIVDGIPSDASATNSGVGNDEWMPNLCIDVHTRRGDKVLLRPVGITSNDNTHQRSCLTQTPSTRNIASSVSSTNSSPPPSICPPQSVTKNDSDSAHLSDSSSRAVRYNGQWGVQAFECRAKFAGDLLIRVSHYDDRENSYLPLLRVLVNSNFVPQDGCLRVVGSETDGYEQFINWLACQRSLSIGIPISESDFNQKILSDSLSVALIFEEDTEEAKVAESSKKFNPGDVALLTYFRELYEKMKKQKTPTPSMQDTKCQQAQSCTSRIPVVSAAVASLLPFAMPSVTSASASGVYCTSNSVEQEKNTPKLEVAGEPQKTPKEFNKEFKKHEDSTTEEEEPPQLEELSSIAKREAIKNGNIKFHLSGYEEVNSKESRDGSPDSEVPQLVPLKKQSVWQ